jgi:hypothetical protein
MKLIGLHFGETVEFMIGELSAFARGKIWDCLGTLTEAGSLSPSVISVLSFFI